MFLLRIWGGVEWGMGMLTTCTCSHGRCYATYTGGVGWSVGMFKEEEEEEVKAGNNRFECAGFNKHGMWSK